MGEVLTLSQMALYDFEGVAPYLFEKVQAVDSLPFSYTNTNVTGKTITPRKVLSIAFNLPDKYKYQKIKVKISADVTIQYQSGTSNYFYCYHYSLRKTTTPLFPNTVSGEAHGISQNYSCYINDDNPTTDFSHGSAPVQSRADGNRNQVLTWEYYAYPGPSNYIMENLTLFAGYPSSGTALGTSSINVKSVSVTVEAVEGFQAPITVLYPDNVNVKNTSDCIFTWKRENNIDEGGYWDQYNLPILKSGISYRKASEENYTSIVENGDLTYLEVEANTFDVSPYKYKVDFYDTYDNILPCDDFDFNAIGQDAAPTINSVTNDSIPLISWTDVNQEAYEVRIKDLNQKVIYDSGIIAGTNQSFRLPMMLADGSYIVEVREINTYGYYSEWGSLEFTINPTAVNAPTDIFATTNNKYGVEISGTPDENAQKTYVVRRKVGSDNIEILGEYTGGIFTDYTAEGNTFYEYTLRNYNYAYNDGFWIPIQVKVKQVVIRDGRNPENFIPLDKSEQENFGPQWTEDADRVLFNCLGRRYPVKEVGEWVNSLRTFNAYVHNRDLNRLLDMVLNAAKVYYMADGEYFACDMAIEDQGTYNQNGRIINFTMTRIADDESVSII